MSEHPILLLLQALIAGGILFLTGWFAARAYWTWRDGR